MYERYKLLKSNDNNILNCNYDHFISSNITLFGVILSLFYFKSGFTPCADIVNQTIGQFVGIRLTNLIRHKSEKNTQSWLIGREMFHAGILCCAGVQINIQTFRAEFFRSLVDH